MELVSAAEMRNVNVYDVLSFNSLILMMSKRSHFNITVFIFRPFLYSGITPSSQGPFHHNLPDRVGLGCPAVISFSPLVRDPIELEKKTAHLLFSYLDSYDSLSSIPLSQCIGAEGDEVVSAVMTLPS